MGCGCSIDSYTGDESYTFHATNMRLARKEHKCEECSRVIERGETYEHSVGLYEGEFQVNKTCPDCLSLRDTLFCSWVYGSLWEDFEEEVYKYPESVSYDALARLTPFALAKACAIIEEVWEEVQS